MQFRSSLRSSAARFFDAPTLPTDPATYSWKGFADVVGARLRSMLLDEIDLRRGEGSALTRRRTMNDRAHELSQEAILTLIAQVQAGKSEALVAFLSTMARFHRYSWHNCLLIHLQKPNATHVAGFRKWFEFGRHVNAGEKGILILVPIVKRTPKKMMRNALTSPGDERADIQLAEGFTTGYVFDISQTSGEELFTYNHVLGDPDRFLPRLEGLTRLEGIDLSYVSSLGGADGVSRNGRIEIVKDLPPAKKFSVLAHELAHELMHQRNRNLQLDKSVKETEAEAVAFVVSKGIGLDSGTSSSDYLQLWGGNADLLIKSMARIKATSTDILRAVLDKP